ncbi:MAG: F-box protein [Candidatus Amoebophilus sp.]
MKKRYFLPLLQVACFMLISVLLQSCGGFSNLPIEVEPAGTIDQEEGQVSIIGENQEQQQASNTLPILMPELWQYIFSQLDFEGVLAARTVSPDWNELITGFRQASIVGVENKPCHIIDTSGWTRKKEIDFRRNKLKALTPVTIPSFAFYHLLGHVKNLPQSFWHYLQGTKVHTLDLTYNKIGDAGASQLVQHLQGTSVHTLNLWGNEISAAGASQLVQHLQGTSVHTLNLSWNKIGAAGASQLAQHLQGTSVHTLHLSYNEIGAAGASQLAQHLQGTSVHTLDLYNNQIGAAGASQLVQHLQGTSVHTLYLSRNQIGDIGASQIAQHLQGTSVHTLDLSRNQIGDTGASQIAQHLQGTSVHTLYLSENQIGDTTQQLLVEQYPHIKWVF